MREDGNGSAERAIQQHLLGGVGNVIGSANDVSDAHIDVVDHHAHLVHRLSKVVVTFSRAHQYEVFDFVVGKFALAENGVQKFGGAANRNFEAHRGLHTECGLLTVAAGAARDAAKCSSLSALFGMIAANVF